MSDPGLKPALPRGRNREQFLKEIAEDKELQQTAAPPKEPPPRAARVQEPAVVRQCYVENNVSFSVNGVTVFLKKNQVVSDPYLLNELQKRGIPLIDTTGMARGVCPGCRLEFVAHA